MSASDPDALTDQHIPARPLQRLAAIEQVDPAGQTLHITRPITPLRQTTLFTNRPEQPNVISALSSEIESSDRIDAVLAFITWNGVRLLINELKRHIEKGRKLRIITTTYLQFTELRALEELQNLGAEIKVSYDETSTRLHAKAWMFHRSTSFPTIYIGSSNLTKQAQVTGKEWNVRASAHVNPELVNAFVLGFNEYWASPEFRNFNADEFQAASTTKAAQTESYSTPPANIKPYPFQQEMLDQLEADRARGYNKNLVVAATGTGKTIIAAMDFRRLLEAQGQARLLFIAHRQEILQQSQARFRDVLGDPSFGELWVGGQKPKEWKHVFASIQSLTKRDFSTLDREQFDVVIIDEFHHAAAPTYEAMLQHLRPRHLLGLTATPERPDGRDILKWFDGRISVELRLWDALEQDLLAPFHYFGIFDGTDLSRIKWTKGAYDPRQIENLYTGTDVVAQLIVKEVREKIADPSTMRALGFCTSIRHAEFMADFFEKSGISSVAVTSKSKSDEREAALEDLEEGRIQVICTVDLFNEGIDVPAIDVILMLRPTESATVFLQQLGRGLRKYPDKDVLTVLDFVGHQNEKFRFDLRYRRMVGRTRRQLESDIEQGFPYLPSGCYMELDRISQEIVLLNLKRSISARWTNLKAELQELGDLTLKEFLSETSLEIEDIYATGKTWNQLRSEAGLSAPTLPDLTDGIGRGIMRLLHTDDFERLNTYRDLLKGEAPPRINDLDTSRQRQLHRLLLGLYPTKGKEFSIEQILARLWRSNALRSELIDVLDLIEDRVPRIHPPLSSDPDIPIQLHATYSRDEILAAFGESTYQNRFELQAGVHWSEKNSTDLLFVTINKKKNEFSETTMYNDYLLSTSHFHWESQSRTSVASADGHRYNNHQRQETKIALFLRAERNTARNTTAPYVAAGYASYEHHESERPIKITWKLDHPLPQTVFLALAKKVA
tara:strand:+ start:4310 stop:7168 length:2859 start_codon:yes stop_codon:yes gene_type:complete